MSIVFEYFVHKNKSKSTNNILKINKLLFYSFSLFFSQRHRFVDFA